jgi:hypothetical protein
MSKCVTKCSNANQLIAKLDKEHKEAVEYIKTDIFPSNKFVHHLLSDLSGITLYTHMMQTGLDDNFDEVFGSRKLIAYSPNFNGNILLPLQFPRITHEIGHMVEINDIKRIFKNDWGQKMLTKYHSTSSQFAALAREQRVYTLEKIMGFESPYELRSDANHGWKMTSDKFKTQVETNAWLYRIVEKTRADWNKDRIEHEWFKRINMLREANNTTIKLAALVVFIILRKIKVYFNGQEDFC